MKRTHFIRMIAAPLVAMFVVSSGCIFYAPKPDCTPDGTEFCRGVIPTDFVEMSLPIWLVPSGGDFGVSPYPHASFQISADKSFAVLKLSHGCLFLCSSGPRPFDRYYELDGIHRYDSETNGTIYAFRDHEPENFASWYVRERAFVVQNRSGPLLESIEGITSDGIPFTAKVRNGYHVDDGPVQSVTFIHPVFGSQKIWPKPYIMKEPLEPPDFSSAARMPFKVSRDLLWVRNTVNQTVPGISASVPASEVDVLCIQSGNARLNASAPLTQGFPENSGAACRFQWHDINYDDLLGPNDTFSFTADNHYIGFMDCWANKQVLYE